MGNTVLTIQDVSLRYQTSHKNILNHIHLQITQGECVSIIGKTGSGKTTLLLAIAGFIEKAEISGTIQIFQSQNRHPVGLILQNPDTQLLSQTVGEEVAFGLENLCVPPDQMKPLIINALKAVGLDKPLDFKVKHLSMGQKYRLIIASQLVMSPCLILLDEPCGQLDQPGIDDLCQIILTLKKNGISFLICEHHARKLKNITDQFYEMDKHGHLFQITPNDQPDNNRNDTPADRRHLSEVIIQMQQVSIGFDHKKQVLSHLNATIHKGDIVAIYGKNGSGKTMLLRSICGFIKPSKGKILICEYPPIPAKLRYKAGILFQNPQKQLFELTVFNELSFKLKRLNIDDNTIQKRIQGILDQLDLTDTMHESPFKLSYGQKHLVAMASILVNRPEIILLDDPFAGIDRQMAQKIIDALKQLNREYQSTIIWTSHEIGLFQSFSTQTIMTGLKDN
jgi:energy-coupling factor transport system ATP-binding protein